MAAPAAAPAAVYIGGAALVAGAAYLLTPPGRRTSETLGQAIYDGGADAVENIRSLFSSDEDEDAQATPTTTTRTNSTTKDCDGPHRGRIQVQGFDPRVDPRDFNTMIPPITFGWNEPCFPPTRAVGLAQLSTNLLVQTQNVRFESAGLRGPAFSKMSQHIKNAPPMGFYARHVTGWNHLGRRALGSGRNVPRVDLEVTLGRAFGDS